MSFEVFRPISCFFIFLNCSFFVALAWVSLIGLDFNILGQDFAVLGHDFNVLDRALCNSPFCVS